MIVVGAGASGLVAAICAARLFSHVAVVEARPRAGRSILASGNGRCNLTHAQLSARAYNDPALVEPVIGADGLERILGFFEELGLWCLPDDDGRYFPRSRAAASVLDVLLREIERLGVQLVCDARVVGVSQEREGWQVMLDSMEPMAADVVIWAAGGRSASLLASQLGLDIADERPVLCPLATKKSEVAGLDGVRASCHASLWRASRKEPVWQEDGEVLFRPYGVSGIVVFNASRFAQAGDTLSLDLMPDISGDELAYRLENRLSRWPFPLDDRFLEGVLHPALSRAMMRRCGRGDAQRMARELKDMRLTVTGTADETHAQVTRGGVRASEVDSHTLECRRQPGLFVCGEALDVDAPCGGYNLSWAWLSGIAAGTASAGS